MQTAYGKRNQIVSRFMRTSHTQLTRRAAPSGNFKDFSSRHEQQETRPALVLAHGFLGGRKLPGSPFEYFRGIAKDLDSLGYDVLTTEVPPTSPVPVRAQTLLEQIAAWDGRRGRRVSILAHSMGGLDSRFAISKLGADSLVETLLTISTPHHGTPLADLILEFSTSIGLAPFMRTLPSRLLSDLPDAGRCLSTEAAASFNSHVLDSPDVRYISVGGHRGSTIRTSPELMATFAYIEGKEGPNDGAVSVKSATWGTYSHTLDMDHLHQINFPFPHRWISGAPTFREVVLEYRRLAALATTPPNIDKDAHFVPADDGDPMSKHK